MTERTRARSPLEAMIDAACSDPNAKPPEPEPCYLCGKTAEEGCRCWILLRCEICDDTTMVEREPDDEDADELITRCPRHAEAPPGSPPRAT